MAVTDLTGTRWQFNDTITAEAQYGIFNLAAEASDSELSTWTDLYVGYQFYRGEFTPIDNGVLWAPALTLPVGEFTITGGIDATNSDLISWLQSNATQIQDEPTNTFSIGNLPVANMYVGTRQVRKIYIGNVLVWEKEVEPIPENALLIQDGKLFTSNGGYLITTEVNLISFNVVNASYQAEEGMTWGEWVNSKYNTDGFYAVGDRIAVPSGAMQVAGATSSSIIVANTRYNVGGSSAD